MAILILDTPITEDTEAFLRKQWSSSMLLRCRRRETEK